MSDAATDDSTVPSTLNNVARNERQPVHCEKTGKPLIFNDSANVEGSGQSGHARDIVIGDRVFPGELVERIEAAFPLSWDGITSDSRSQMKVAVRRAIALLLTRDVSPGWTVVEVGKLLCRNHKSILNSRNKMDVSLSGSMDEYSHVARQAYRVLGDLRGLNFSVGGDAAANRADDEAAALRSQGFSLEQIAERQKVSTQTVVKRLRRITRRQAHG